MESWHQLDTAALLEQLATDGSAGLTAAEARLRLARFGPNELQAAKPISPWKIFGEQVKNILVIILLVAVGLSAFLGHTVEAIAIAVIVLFAVLLGAVVVVVIVVALGLWRGQPALELFEAAGKARLVRRTRVNECPGCRLGPGGTIQKERIR